MDSHSRSASPREPIRPQHRPPSPPSTPVAFDNRAYQHDEADPNHNDSFTSNGPQQNGHSKEPNGDTKTLEAVNLELINLTPKNGTAKQKKDVEVDMNASNPYDEYFVPVNEHRKYMRGEKLYVTADKRGEKGGCKRPLCWTLLGLVVAAIVAIIVLAATGILFTNSPTTLEQYNTSISSARALGGLGPVQAHDHEHDHDHDHNHNDQHDHTTEIPANSEHGPETQSDEGQDHSMISDDSADSSLYVPRTVEGELKIDSDEFTPMLQDPESTEYKEFVATFTEGLKRALFDRHTLENGDDEINIEVIQLREGSIIVTYRIHWKPKIYASPTEDLLTASSLKTKLSNYLDTNDRMISIYHIAEDKMATRRVLDICHLNKNDCEHGCEFNEITLDFTCTCPHGQILDMSDPKKCMSLLGNSDDINEGQKEIKEFTMISNPSTTKAMPDVEKPATESVKINENDNTFDWKETHHMMPDTTTTTDTDVNFPHIFGHPQHDERVTEDSLLESNSEEKPDQVTEPKPEPEPTSEPQPIAELQPTEESESKEQSVEEPDSTNKPKPKSEPQPSEEPVPTTEPEPITEIVSAAKPQPEEPSPTAEHKPYLELEPAAEPESTAEPQATIFPQSTTEPHPIAEPQPASEPIPTAEPQPAVELYPSSEFKTSTESQPPSEAETESSSKFENHPQSDVELKSTTGAQNEPITESSFGNHNIEHSSEIIYEPLPTLEPEPQHIPQDHSLVNRLYPNTVHTVLTETTMLPPSVSESDSNIIHHELETATESYSHSEPESSSKLNKLEIDTTTSNPDSNENPEHTFSENNENEVNENSTEMNIKINEETKSQVETTTLRISISEPKIINEPSYEPKPEIISILSDNKEHTNEISFLTHNETNQSSTETSDWLEDNTEKNIKDETQYKSTTESSSESDMETTDNNLNQEHKQESESRSFKSFDNNYVFTTTTQSSTKLEGGAVLSDIITKEKPILETESANNLEDETTTVAMSLIPVIVSQEPENQSQITSIETTTTSITELNDKVVLPISPVFIPAQLEDTTEITNQSQDESKSEGSKITSLIEEAKSLDTPKSIQSYTTIAIKPEIVTEYSILNHHGNSEEDKKLLEALENKSNLESNETRNTDSNNNTSDESTDVTFDAINMLYNRSSKSIEAQNKSQFVGSDINEVLKDATPTTTESDWLSESATELKYDEAMNKMERHETTETTINKIDEVMNHELTKDDFEPDYLNNMSSNKNKMSEQDEPIYGMMHDYDTEDSRIKRVNKDKEMKTETPTTNESFNVTTKQLLEVTPLTNAPIETTTVSEYIYNTAEKMKHSDEVRIIPTFSVLQNIDTTTTVKPAAVWEEPEDETDLSVKDIAQKVTEGGTTGPTMISEVVMPVTVATTTSELTTISSTTTVMDTLESINKYENTNSVNGSSDLQTQNTTQINNLNVTIYEISSHNDNNTTTTTKATNTHSSEYEDHETDMNPFLPEIENNKILVKKLQEGHDLEPINVNDTQNENNEDHAISPENPLLKKEIHIISPNNTHEEVINPTTVSSSTEADTSFSDLLMNSKSETIENNSSSETVSPRLRTNEDNIKIGKAQDKETLPVSTFLLDTDDLDVAKDQTNEHKVTVTGNNLSSEGITPFTSAPIYSGTDNGYLSVVPIEQEKAENKAFKSYDSENIQELNDISDSPKKSERTLDDTKFDSVITNEA